MVLYTIETFCFQFRTHPGENHTALTDPKPQPLTDDGLIPVLVLTKLNLPALNNNSKAHENETPEDSHGENSSSISVEELPVQNINKITSSTGPRANFK